MEEKEGGGLLTCFVAAVECVRWKKVKVAHYGFGGKMEVGKSQKLQWKEKGNLSNHNCCTTLVSRILLSMISEENIIA